MEWGRPLRPWTGGGRSSLSRPEASGPRSGPRRGAVELRWSPGGPPRSPWRWPGPGRSPRSRARDRSTLVTARRSAPRRRRDAGTVVGTASTASPPSSARVTLMVLVAWRSALSRRLRTTRASWSGSPRTSTGATPLVSRRTLPTERWRAASPTTTSSRSTSTVRGGVGAVIGLRQEQQVRHQAGHALVVGQQTPRRVLPAPAQDGPAMSSSARLLARGSAARGRRRPRNAAARTTPAGARACRSWCGPTGRSRRRSPAPAPCGPDPARRWPTPRRGWLPPDAGPGRPAPNWSPPPRAARSAAPQ